MMILEISPIDEQRDTNQKTVFIHQLSVGENVA